LLWWAGSCPPGLLFHRFLNYFKMGSKEIEKANPETGDKVSFTANFKYLVLGVFFGIVFIKTEVVSWFRIQEMFRFESFHMFGVIGTAIAVASISLFIIKKFKVKTFSGDDI